jgi:hypothetical protein
MTRVGSETAGVRGRIICGQEEGVGRMCRVVEEDKR